MTKTVEFWFDYGSPTAYLAHGRLKQVAARTGAAVDLRPMLLGAVFQAIKDQLKHPVDQAVARGVFGAPTFFVGDRMWFGQDRLDWVEAELGAAR